MLKQSAQKLLFTLNMDFILLFLFNFNNFLYIAKHPTFFVPGPQFTPGWPWHDSLNRKAKFLIIQDNLLRNTSCKFAILAA